MVSPSKLSTNVGGRQDRISNLPMVLTDKILELLPLHEAAKMSVLSKQWRTNWCCLRKLVFNSDFRERQNHNGNGELEWETYTSIVNNILLRHHGLIHEFCLEIHPKPHDNIFYNEKLNLNPWLCFLSKNGVKKITLQNLCYFMRCVPLPSHIYSCIELEELILMDWFVLKRPPSDFEGFKHIRKLELNSITVEGDILQSLIANCSKLTILTIKNLDNQKNLVIDAPKLENLTLDNSVKFSNIKNVPNLAKLDLCSGIKSITYREAADAIKNLAASCDLKSLHLRDFRSTLFVEIEKMKSFPLALTHLYELSLGEVNLDDFGVFSCTFGFIQSCPSIKKLSISVECPRGDVKIFQNFDHDNNYKLCHLVEVDIYGVTGSKPELKLIEYVLSAAIVLRKLTIKVRFISYETQMKLQTELNALQRASPKARIIVSEKLLIQ